MRQAEETSWGCIIFILTTETWRKNYQSEYLSPLTLNIKDIILATLSDLIDGKTALNTDD